MTEINLLELAQYALNNSKSKLDRVNTRIKETEANRNRLISEYDKQINEMVRESGELQATIVSCQYYIDNMVNPVVDVTPVADDEEEDLSDEEIKQIIKDAEKVDTE